MPRTRKVPVFTSNPQIPAPSLVCPMCDRRLTYTQTVFGGTSPAERWDQFECAPCNAKFEYRERTRSLRPTLEPK